VSCGGTGIRTSRLAVFSDRIEIDGLAIPYLYLLGMQAHNYLGAYPNVVEVVYATADGARGALLLLPEPDAWQDEAAA
jgi:hypothetical protein